MAKYFFSFQRYFIINNIPPPTFNSFSLLDLMSLLCHILPTNLAWEKNSQKLYAVRYMYGVMPISTFL